MAEFPLQIDKRPSSLLSQGRLQHASHRGMKNRSERLGISLKNKI
jgi:hypothetical protein